MSQNPPYFEGMVDDAGGGGGHRRRQPALPSWGDSITTDHISPAGSIKVDSPAGRYLNEHQVSKADFNSYGARRGNHEVMMRGTFANIRIKNEMVPGVEGGMTRYIPTGETLAIYDAAQKYKADGTPLVIVAGKEYGTGSSRDWAAKGTTLLGVRAVITESFERIHRSNSSAWACCRCNSPKASIARRWVSTGPRHSRSRMWPGLRPASDGDGKDQAGRRHRKQFRSAVPDRYGQRARIFPEPAASCPYVLRKLAA